MSTTRRSLARVVAGLVASGRAIGEEVQQAYSTPREMKKLVHLVHAPPESTVPDHISELTAYRRALRDRTVTGVPCATLGIKSYSASYRRHKEAEAFATADRHPVDKMLREFWRNMA